MSESSQITQTTKDDLKRLEDLVTGNYVRSLRVAQKRINRRIIMFERRLIELYNNEKIIKARIYNNADMITIQKNYPSGKNTRVNPVQSFDPQNVAKDPHHAISYDKYNLTKVEEGVKELDAEINRINKEIMMVQAQLNEYTKKKEIIAKELKEAEEKKNTKDNLIDKTVGRILPPTPEDLKQDEISRAEIANRLLLYNLSYYYYEMSYVPETNERKYPDEKKLPQNLLMIRQIFWAHAQPFPEYINEGSDKKLNFDDPGSQENRDKLSKDTEVQRIVAENTKTSLQIDRYMRDLRNVSNDTTISIGVERKPDPTLPASESLREQTVSYPAAALRLGDFYVGSFELPTFTDSIKKWWKKKNEQLYYNLPICPNKPTDLNTNTDTIEDLQDQVQQELIELGQAQYKEKLADAQAVLQTQEDAQLGDLPDDAPDWVKEYAKLYGDASVGRISYGQLQLVVTRAEGLTREDAITNSNKIAPAGSFQVQGYVYFSTESYLVTYKNGTTEFISISKWDAFQADVTKVNSVASQEVRGVYVYYVMWATEEQADILAA